MKTMLFVIHAVVAGLFLFYGIHGGALALYVLGSGIAAVTALFYFKRFAGFRHPYQAPAVLLSGLMALAFAASGALLAAHSATVLVVCAVAAALVLFYVADALWATVWQDMELIHLLIAGRINDRHPLVVRRMKALRDALAAYPILQWPRAPKKKAGKGPSAPDAASSGNDTAADD